MHIFDYAKYKNMSLDAETVSLIAKVYEAKGRQGLFAENSPAILETLTVISKITALRFFMSMPSPLYKPPLAGKFF